MTPESGRHARRPCGHRQLVVGRARLATGLLLVAVMTTMLAIGQSSAGAGNPSAAVLDAALAPVPQPTSAATDSVSRSARGRPPAVRATRSAPAPGAAQILPHGTVDRVDLAPGDAQADAGILDRPSISADGRYVAFATLAKNLGASGVRRSQVLVRDRQTRTTTLVSATPSGAPGGQASSGPAISADGHYVAFESYATDLVPQPTRPGLGNVYLRDLRTGRTTLLSAGPGVAADDDSGSVSIDSTGDRVAFDSRAGNLVAGHNDDTHRGEVYVWDRNGGGVRQISLDPTGGPLSAGSAGPSISADGNKVAFVEAGTRGGTCEDAYVKDLVTGLGTVASVATDSEGGCGHIEDVAMSGDGKHLAFATSWPLSSADHDFTPDVYLRDLTANTTTLVSERKLPGVLDERGASYGASLSYDGRWVAFTSFADDLGADHVARTNSAYLKDLRTGAIRMIAAAPGHPFPGGSSFGVSLTPDAAHVAFASAAENLVPADNNHAGDAFVIDWSGPAYPAAQTPVTAPLVPPHTQIDVGPVGKVAAGLQRFVLTSDTAPTWFQCRFDAGRWHRCGSTVIWNARPGKHRLWARAVDSAGHVDPAPASRVFEVG